MTVTVNYNAIEPGTVGLDTFTGSTDDAKLAAAMSYAAQQTEPPFIALAARDHLFKLPVTMYNGFRLKGCNAERAAYNNSICMAKVNCGAKNWLNVPSGNIQVAQIDTIFFWNTDLATVFMNGPGVVQYSGIHCISTAGFDGVFGAYDDHLSVTELSATGFCSFSGFKRSAINLGGSDSVGLFQDGFGVWTNASIGAYTPQFALANLDKTHFGPIYLTVNSGVGGMDLNNCGSTSFDGGIFEGDNTTSITDGAVLKIRGGSQVRMNGASFGDCMKKPSGPGDTAMVMVSGASEVAFMGCQFYQAPGVATNTPVIAATGGSTVYVYAAMRTTSYGGPAWGSQKPVVTHDSTSTVISDGSVQVVAV